MRVLGIINKAGLAKRYCQRLGVGEMCSDRLYPNAARLGVDEDDAYGFYYNHSDGGSFEATILVRRDEYEE